MRLSTLLALPWFAAAAAAADGQQQVLNGGMESQVGSNYTTKYERIAVADKQDIPRLHSLIKLYIAEPSLADYVTEMTLDSSAWSHPTKRRWLLRGETAAVEEELGPELLPDETDTALDNYSLGLGLSEEHTGNILSSLEWVRYYLVGAWKGSALTRYERESAFLFAATIILLSLCRNISTLHLGRAGYEGPLAEYLLKSNYGQIPKPALQKLKHMELFTSSAAYVDERVYSRTEFMEYFQYFHRLPALESIVMDCAGEYQMDRQFFVEGSGNMKKIHLTHADITSETLSTLLGIPKSLEDINVSNGGLWSTDGGHPLLFAGEVGKRLQQHQLTLKALDLNVEFDKYDARFDDEEDEEELQHMMEYEREAYGPEHIRLDEAARDPDYVDPDTQEWPDKSFLGSLQTFEKLTNLSISLTAFLGTEFTRDAPRRLEKRPLHRFVDVLPPSLEYLCLYDYKRGENADFDEHVDEFLAQREERFPKLKEVKGIEETVKGMMSIYGYKPREADLYKCPERDLGFKEVEGWVE